MFWLRELEGGKLSALHRWKQDGLIKENPKATRLIFTLQKRMCARKPNKPSFPVMSDKMKDKYEKAERHIFQ